MKIDQYKSLLPKKKRKLNQDEYKLHVEVVKHLRSAFPHVLFTHAGKGKNQKHGEDLKKMGYRKGTPDILLWWDCPPWEGTIKAGAIELKSPDGNMSEEQETFDYLFTRMGGLFACCKSKAEVHAHLLNWGIKSLHGPGIEPCYLTKQQKHKLAFDVYAPRKETP